MNFVHGKEKRMNSKQYNTSNLTEDAVRKSTRSILKFQRIYSFYPNYESNTGFIFGYLEDSYQHIFEDLR